MKYCNKSIKISRYTWIWIANRSAKFHAKRLDRSEDIPKSVRGGGLLSSETPKNVCNYTVTVNKKYPFLAQLHDNQS